MKRQIKCGATPELVKEHIQTLRELDKRTIEIKAYAQATVVLVTLFGIVAAIFFGLSEYHKKQESRTAIKETPSVNIASVKKFNGIEETK